MATWFLQLFAGSVALAEDEQAPVAVEAGIDAALFWLILPVAFIFALLWLFTRLKLQKSRQQVNNLSNILDSLNVYVYQKDIQGRYTYVNQKEADLWQADKRDVIGKDDSAFFDSAMAEAIKNTDREVISSGAPVTREETTVLRHSGKTEICVSTKQPIFDETGRVSGILGVSTDITEYKRIENRELTTNHILRILASEPSAAEVLNQLIQHRLCNEVLPQC